MNPPFFPTLNASLNLLAGTFLLLGWLAIRRGERKLHQRMMVCALAASAVFLTSYLTYHLMLKGVPTKYEGTGLKRSLYFTILLTHTPLAALIVPVSLAAVWQAYKKNFAAHKKITRWLYPTWIYVSVTGVLIYVMLYLIR